MDHQVLDRPKVGLEIHPLKATAHESHQVTTEFVSEEAKNPGEKRYNEMKREPTEWIVHADRGRKGNLKRGVSC